MHDEWHLSCQVYSKEAAAGTVKLTLYTRRSLYLELKRSSGTLQAPRETSSMRASVGEKAAQVAGPTFYTN